VKAKDSARIIGADMKFMKLLGTPGWNIEEIKAYENFKK
jgi:hypothetical protein